MKKRLFLSVLFFCCVAALLPLMAQNAAAVEKHFLEDVMFARGKINVVFSVVIIIVVGILGYWLYLHRQISKYNQNDVL